MLKHQIKYKKHSFQVVQKPPYALPDPDDDLSLCSKSLLEEFSALSSMKKPTMLADRWHVQKQCTKSSDRYTFRKEHASVRGNFSVTYFS
jgi:hypothetical protein